MKIYVVGSVYGGSDQASWINEYPEFHTDRNVHKMVTSIEEADLLIFTGGADINPSIYNQKNVRSGPASRRDEEEVEAFKKAKALGKPMFGICRGFQLLAALSGATLYQDVTGHGNGAHEVITPDNRVFSVTSLHHQMVNLTNMPEEDYVILAVSCKDDMPGNISRHYIDAGPDGEIRENKADYEVEMAYFPKTKCLGVQGHPEFIKHVNTFTKECNDMLQKYLFNNENRAIAVPI